MDQWDVEERQIAFDHERFRIVIDRLRRGDETKPYLYLESPVDSVSTLAITGAGEVVLTRQYRHPIRQIIYDLPAGRANIGEVPIEGARRELQEETGYRAGVMIPLGSFSPFPGSLKVTAHLFFARDLIAGEQQLDEGEDLQVHLRPFDEVYAEILAGQHIDGHLQMAALMARARGLV